MHAVAQALNPIPNEPPLILVGHSGGGALLPAVRQLTGRPVAAYIFVDAGIPKDEMSRLDHFSPEQAEQSRRRAAGGYIPTWTSADQLIHLAKEMDVIDKNSYEH